MLRRFALLLVLLAGLGSIPAAQAHIPPPFWMDIEITGESVVWEITIEGALYEEWFGGPAKTISEVATEEQELLRVQVDAFYRKFVEVRIDKVPVKGAFDDLTISTNVDDELELVYAIVRMSYATKGRPRQVDLTWKKFDSKGGWWMKGIETEIDAFGEADYVLISKEEPQFIWHAPKAATVANPFDPPASVAAPRVVIPLFSVALLAVGLIAFPFIRSRPRIRFGAIGVAAILAVALSGVGRAEVDLPWGPRFERPAEEQATEIFTALHKNIYRAFDYENEEDIYETLRLSVTGDLLERIYTEVYQGLILRDQGGAVMKIQSVKILASEVAYPESPEEPWFTVKCRWQVRGKVGHSGHVHMRVNEYQAIYTMSLRDEGWRIAALKVTEQMRVDDQGYGRTPGEEVK